MKIFSSAPDNEKVKKDVFHTFPDSQNIFHTTRILAISQILSFDCYKKSGMGRKNQSGFQKLNSCNQFRVTKSKWFFWF